MNHEIIKCGDCLAHYPHGNLHICDPMMKGLKAYHDRKNVKITCLSIDCPERKGGECNAFPLSPNWKKRYKDTFSFLVNASVTEPGIFEDRPLYDVVEEFMDTVYREGYVNSKEEVREIVEEKKWGEDCPGNKVADCRFHQGYNKACDHILKAIKEIK